MNIGSGIRSPHGTEGVPDAINPEAIIALLKHGAWTVGPVHVPADWAWWAGEHLARTRDLLAYMLEVEREPCRLDHHGHCQEHPGGFRDDGGCWIAAARDLLGVKS